LKKLAEELKKSDLAPDEIWRRVCELGEEQTTKVSKKAAEAAGEMMVRNRLVRFVSGKTVRKTAQVAKTARKGATEVPIVGALVTTAFTAYDFATSPYPSDTDVIFHPRVDYTIEQFLDSVALLPLFPMSAEEFIEMQQRAAFEAAWQSKLPAPGAALDIPGGRAIRLVEQGGLVVGIEGYLEPEEESTGSVIIVP
jgi:hypothetical protein